MRLPPEREYHHAVAACEMLYGQPRDFYEQLRNSGTLEEFNFDAYHLLITGLTRSVYRDYFGMDAFDYTVKYYDLECELHQLLEERGVSCITTMLLYDQSKRMCMLFNTARGIDAHTVAEIVASCFSLLYARIFDMSKTPYRNYTVLSEEIHGYEELQNAFKELDFLSRQQFFDMQTMVMTPSLLEHTRVAADRNQIREDLTKMFVALRAGEAAETLDHYHTVMAQLQQARDFDLLSDVLSSIRFSMENTLCSHGMKMSDECRDAFSIEHHPTFQMQQQAIEMQLNDCLNSLENTRPMSVLVQDAVLYIRHHYADDVALADVAQHIGMSESWLTRQFKRECGCSVANYLLTVRIERAKALLLETEMLVQDIAEAVGFDKSGYFISVFKRIVGTTPKTFREQAESK